MTVPRRRTTRLVVEIVLLQVGWFACVGGAARDLHWLGPLVVAFLLAVHLRGSDAPRRDLLLICLLGGVGTVLDSVQSGLGLLGFRGAPAAWLCPPWITALWLHFGVGLRGPMASFATRPWAAAAFGMIGGPLAYWAGVRLGAASFHAEPWWSIASIAIVWGTVFPLALRFAHPPSTTPISQEDPTCAPSY